ncbi:glucokinase [Sulfuricurvum sp.]|uniref:glucokinase n=1 Tax=Sulfuricurvum sp. TaxID=2025608 RepID=UPI002D60A288|nr:glucokinase [Sulfuricurvum sp.]HZF70176.1 glucokinase [Sulfuricurvum sp.]
MILAGDIGGTKTNLALFEMVEGTPRIQVRQQYESRAFSSLSDVITAFKADIKEWTVDAACFGIAGPIIAGNCKTTNLPWEITTADLQTQLQTDKVRLLNDLEATAYGMLYLRDEEFVTLNTGESVNANRAVIAAGTGLGEAMLFWDGAGYYPVGSEGGHTDFAPMNEQHDDLLRWLRVRYPSHVSIERILSGPGIAAVYYFLRESGFAPEPKAMLGLSEGEERSALISRCALEENDPLCVETLRLFVEIYGSEAGNLALKTMSLGGVYIGGGIAPKILPAIVSGTFMEAFVKKGRFEALLRSMPVKISLNAETALLGAAHFAADRL